MTPVTVLVVAKAPVPGQVKTRLAATVGDLAAADLAAAALLDTIEVADRTAHRLGSRPAVLALTGDLADASRGHEIATALRGCRVIAQRGVALGQRLAAAHQDAAGPAGGAVLQIGMDTPQVRADLLEACAGLLLDGRCDAVLGPAEDGGWWLLGVRRAVSARAVRTVAMSTARTGLLTREALAGVGCTVHEAPSLRDVDVVDDAVAVAALAPKTRFATALSAITAPIQ
jgi:glycosyltransferase A (GT-A) superfamily protein (DUF2064 family)